MVLGPLRHFTPLKSLRDSIFYKRMFRARLEAGLSFTWSKDQFHHFCDNDKLYIKPILQSLWLRCIGKKIITVFIMGPTHWPFIEDIVNGIIEKQEYVIQVFYINSRPKLNINSDLIKFFDVTDVKPAESGLVYYPFLISDLFITPTSANAIKVVAKCPKVALPHSLIDIDNVYDPGSYDNYDYIMATGPHHMVQFKQLFKSNKAVDKYVLPCGYPRIDALYRRIKEARDSNSKVANNKVIIAPTVISKLNINQSLVLIFQELVHKLLAAEFHVVFRPHPINLEPTNDYFGQMNESINLFLNHKNFTLDKSEDYLEIYKDSMSLISDMSGTGLTYMFCFEKPAFFFKSEKKKAESKMSLNKKLQENDLVFHSTDEIVKKLIDIRGNPSANALKIIKLRQESIYNFGTSSSYFLDNLDLLLNKQRLLQIPREF